MKSLAAAGRLQRVLFTDEKLFTVQPHLNCQNHRQLLRKGQQKTRLAKTIGHSHFPSSVMVWAGISAAGKTPLVFIDRNVKINAISYQQSVLQDVLQPWALQNFGENGFMLQQD